MLRLFLDQYLSITVTVLPIAGVVLSFGEDMIRMALRRKKWNQLGEKRKKQLRTSVSMRIDPRGSKLSLGTPSSTRSNEDNGAVGLEMVTLGEKAAEAERQMDDAQGE